MLFDDTMLLIDTKIFSLFIVIINMLFIILHIIYRKLITIFTNVKRQKNYYVKANVL